VAADPLRSCGAEQQLEALRARDPLAWGCVFDSHAPRVRRTLARALGSDQDVADLVQDVFVHAIGGIDTLREPRALAMWLTRIAVFLARGRIRSRMRARHFARVMALISPAHAPVYAGTEAARATYSVLDRLSADERLAFVFRFLEGMELTEIAQAMDLSVPTVKRRLDRAKERFARFAASEPALAEHLAQANEARWPQRLRA
jgi:RNA polymerase sigma-70 factor (ECF subfamily)